MAKLKKNINKLRESYSKLSQEEKWILQLSSIVYDNQKKKEFSDYYREWVVTVGEGKRTTYKVIDLCCASLIRKGFLLSDTGIECVPLFINDATIMAAEDGVLESMITAIFTYEKSNNSFFFFDGSDNDYRDLRFELYRGNYDEFIDQLYKYQKSRKKYSISFLMNKCFNSPFNQKWFSKIPGDLQITALTNLFNYSIYKLENVNDLLPVIETFENHIDKFNDSELGNPLIEFYILKGKFDKAKSLIKDMVHPPSKLKYTGLIDFLEGRNNQAILNFSAALIEAKKNSRKKITISNDVCGIFYALALFKTEDTSYYETILNIVDSGIKKKSGNKVLYSCLKALLFYRQHMTPDANYLLSVNYSDCLESDNIINVLVSSLVILEIDKTILENFRHHLESFFTNLVEYQYEWLAMEFANLLVRVVSDNTKHIENAIDLEKKTGARTITGIIKTIEPWEHSLKALACFKTGASNTYSEIKSSSGARMVWFYSEYYDQLYPREQVINTKGVWSKGRPVALERVMKEELDCMTAHDRKIANCIEKHVVPTYGYYTETSYRLNHDKACFAIIGHPLIFLSESPTVNVEFVKGDMELLVEQSGNKFEIKFSSDFNDFGSYIVKESQTRFKVINVTEEHLNLKEIIGEKSLKVPKNQKQQVLDVIKNLASVVTIHSDLNEQVGDIPEVKSDNKIYVQLIPMGAGLMFQMIVKPFRHGGAHFMPGEGGTNVYTELNGKNVRTKRNLGDEKKNALDVINACSRLSEMESPGEELLFEEPEDCLLLIQELQALEGSIVVEWPKGGTLSVSKPVSFDNLKLSIKKENDWFAVSGELKIDKSLTLDIQKIVELVKTSPTQFIEIGKGKFLTLTKQFKKRLDEMSAISEQSKKGIKFHSLATIFVQDFVEEVKELKVDENWNAHVKRLKDIEDFQPKLPTTLQAELRPYQIDGFNWLSRLAYWGVGACLADDMGLGKTLQALALILERTKNGPTLVVAPASVCFNWIQEALRFAPTLNVTYFGTTKREKTLKSLAGFDLLVCSYGLLQSEIEMISKVPWHTIVLDEAQAIKNLSTKRSKAAMQLQGDFKMLTTGTPIENHLGELWNLFRFINPGLLGSLERFSEIFADPIERDGDNETKMRLKRLIHPFILRRIKSQVLEELPEKTEITLSVELTVKEASFYEALRLEAVKSLEEKGEDGAGKKVFKILAEIMKLRRACCHPSLVLPDCPVESTKLSLFTEIVKDLMDNKHKALVFSQFVDHLNIIREQVEKLGISYQYLDGSTPMKERKNRVDAFQNGEGDLFLISLKAGGLGLNLTAADYVIHMDPWWNPAVEDQASDRAHRIGQQRPVTVYRLVTKDTIEEKIVKLHSAKRNLADSLLEGTESSARISAEQLLQLIREN